MTYVQQSFLANVHCLLLITLWKAQRTNHVARVSEAKLNNLHSGAASEIGGLAVAHGMTYSG